MQRILWLLVFLLSSSYTTHALADISDGVVRIGVLNDQTGPLAEYSGPGSVIAVRMAVEDFGGRVRGAPIEIVVADHQNKPEIATSIARQWFDLDKVDVITDLTSSAISLAVQDYGRSRGKIIIHVGSGTDRLYGADCSPTGFLWVYDTYSFAKALGKVLSVGPDATWFLILADTAFATSMEAQLVPVIEGNGGRILGRIKHPVGTADFASFLLQAQSSGAKNIALLNTGADTANAIKQGSEFGLDKSSQSLLGTVIYLQTIHSIGLKSAQGIKFVTSFYWDRTDETRAFAKRFQALSGGKMPSQVHAGMYSATLAYLRAIDAAGTDDGKAVSAKLKELPVNDFFAEGAKVRADGRLMKDVFLVEVKKPNESAETWDYYKVLERLKAEDVIRPLEAGGCNLNQ
jgi:branched-chain amino acid transport system substrate-binding protein